MPYVRLALLGLTACASLSYAQGTLIASTLRRDHAFDATGSTLYLTTSQGRLNLYDAASTTLTSSFSVGQSLLGMDITPDGATAFIADREVAGSFGLVRRVDLATGQTTSLAYPRAFGENYTWDIVMVSNERGFVTTTYAGSGSTPLRELNAVNNSLTIRAEMNHVRGGSRMHRSGDRSRGLFTESDSSFGSVWNYTTSSNVFSTAPRTNAFLEFAPVSLSRDGAFHAIGLSSTLVYNAQFAVVATLPFSAGCAFDPSSDRFYLVNPTTDRIEVYRTSDWSVERFFAVGENMNDFSAFGAGVMSISGNGARLALSTPSGVRVYSVPAPAAALTLALGAFMSRGRRRFPVAVPRQSVSR